MASSRITISISAELNEALRSIARATNESVSSIAAQALAQRVRDAAIDDFLLHAAEKFGEIPAEALESADRLLAKAAARARQGKVEKAAA